MVKTEPTALAAGIEAADIAQVRPAASAVGSHDVCFSPSRVDSWFSLKASEYCVAGRATVQSDSSSRQTLLPDRLFIEPRVNLNPGGISYGCRRRIPDTCNQIGWRLLDLDFYSTLISSLTF